MTLIIAKEQVNKLLETRNMRGVFEVISLVAVSTKPRLKSFAPSPAGWEFSESTAGCDDDC